MISNILRILVARSFKPLKFTSKGAKYIDNNVDNFGIYVHVPFCEKLCSFCPYNKVLYNKRLASDYLKALIKEIDLVARSYKGKTITSVYFGGGTPALLIDELDIIVKKLKEYFIIEKSIGIELHPRDINKELASKLIKIGFDMVSVGIQSFQKEELKTLGREYINGTEKVEIVKEAGFRVIDVDLIFGIGGQTDKRLKVDFLQAFKSGATQVSTYPFIDFSYANNKDKPLGGKGKKHLLNMLEEISKGEGIERTAVWTFGIKNTEKYSSITRDTYIGFGPSASTLTNSSFKINTFNIKEYIKSVDSNENPKALTMEFSKRMRSVYWLFWNAYTLKLSKENYLNLMRRNLEEDFGIEIFLSRLFRLLRRTKEGYELTKLGAYIYHILEQHYTHQYIDKTWKVSKEEAWPKEVKLY